MSNDVTCCAIMHIHGLCLIGQLSSRIQSTLLFIYLYPCTLLSVLVASSAMSFRHSIIFRTSHRLLPELTCGCDKVPTSV